MCLSCEIILEQNRLVIRDNVDLNEILTDCAVVYFGFENIMSRGRQECLKRSIKIGILPMSLILIFCVRLLMRNAIFLMIRCIVIGCKILGVKVS